MPHLYKDIPGWFTYQSLYDEMIEKYHSLYVDSEEKAFFAEVGCWFGQSSVYMLEKLNELKSDTFVLFVDTWLGGVGEPEWDLVRKHGFNYVYNEFILNVAKTGHLEYDIRRQFSHLQPNFMDDYESYDFVFIDAGHRGWQCYDDLAAWYPKVKTGGTIAGHDIDYKDVRASVDRYCNENKLSYEIRKSPEHCWVIQV